MRKLTSSNHQNRKALIHDCPIMSTFELLGGRWKLHILYQLSTGPLRYTELKSRLTGVSDKMLAQQIRELQVSGFILRYSLPHVVPVGTEYTLTSLGKSILPLMDQIREWGAANGMVETYHNLIAADVEDTSVPDHAQSSQSVAHTLG